MRSKLVRILYGEAKEQVLSAQKKAFEAAGYVVVSALGREAIEDALMHSKFDLVILGHTVTRDDRHHLPYMVKKANSATRVLVLHASGKHPKVDIALDSRYGEAAVLEVVAELLSAGDASQVSRDVMAVA